jgi:hypothetical protein
VNSFGKAIAHVQNCLLKKMHMAQTKTLTKTTQKGGFSKLCVKIKKSNSLYAFNTAFRRAGIMIFLEALRYVVFFRFLESNDNIKHAAQHSICFICLMVFTATFNK